MRRRNFLRSSFALGALSATGAVPILSLPQSQHHQKENPMLFQLTQLPYAYDALEPYIDKMTMEIHHGKHHNAYLTNFNKALEGTEYAGKSFEEIFGSISKAPAAIRNNGGGHFNHDLYWNSLKPGGGVPTGELVAAINRDFGSFEKFKEQFSNAGITRFGSGWAWLVKQHDKLVVCSTPNQDNPLMDIAEVKGTPLLNMDVWEHAYYLKYQNRRADYVSAFWNVINWDHVAALFAGVK